MYVYVCVCAVTRSGPTLCNPIDCSPPGFFVHGISQAKILEWVAISYSRGFSRPWDWNCVSCWAIGEAQLEGTTLKNNPKKEPWHKNVIITTFTFLQSFSQNQEVYEWAEDFPQTLEAYCKLGLWRETRKRLQLQNGLGISPLRIVLLTVSVETNTNFCGLKCKTSVTFRQKHVWKYLPAMQELQGDTVSIPRWERSPWKSHATYSSILAWRISRTEEPGRLQSTALQRVGHNWSDLALQQACTCFKPSPLILLDEALTHFCE